jgi:hypothetical protein
MIVAAMSIEQSARDLRSIFVAGMRYPHLKSERGARNPGRESETRHERA